MSDGILSVSDYKPNYIDRDLEPCPHCGEDALPERTNRYLFRCINFEFCGRYW